MCCCLNVSRNAYYVWRFKPESKNGISNRDILVKEIQTIFIESRETYGSPRIAEALSRKGIKVSRTYVALLMKEENICCYRKRKHKNTTQSNHNYEVADNILDRNFNPIKLGQNWVSDITYIKVAGRWIYLTTVIDLADRQVIGWSLSNDMTYNNTVLKAWRTACRRRAPCCDLIFHSDRGVQYACNEMKKEFAMNEMKQSMSRKGNCWDNAVAESFFKTIKVELIYRRKYLSFQHAYLDIYDYIENWYNIKRMHSALGYKTPLEKEVELKGYNKIAA